MNKECEWFLWCALTALSQSKDTVLTRAYLRNALKTASVTQRAGILKALRHVRRMEGL